MGDVIIFHLQKNDSLEALEEEGVSERIRNNQEVGTT